MALIPKATPERPFCTTWAEDDGQDGIPHLLKEVRDADHAETWCGARIGVTWDFHRVPDYRQADCYHCLEAYLNFKSPFYTDEVHTIYAQPDHKLLVTGRLEEIVRDAFREGYQRAKEDIADAIRRM